MTQHLRICIAALLPAMTLTGVHATDITLQAPGLLSNMIEAPEAITTLCVSGPIDATDVMFISSLPNLEKLDLTAATVSEYNGAALKPTAVTTSAANTIPPYSFMGCTATAIALPSGITAIGPGAFAGSRINEIAIPRTVVEIGDDAFASSALTCITLPQSVTSIGRRAFAGCASLGTAVIEGAVTAMPDGLFDRCSSLVHLTLPPTITAIGANALQGTALGSIDLSACGALTSVGDWAFAHSPQLTAVILPNSVSTLGRGTFMGDASLTTVSLSSALGNLPDFMLCGASAVAGINLPGATETIGTYAMAGMDALAAINAGTTTCVPDLGPDVWSGVDKSRVTLSVPAELMTAYSTADQWRDFNIQEASSFDDIMADSCELTVRMDGRILIVTAPQTIRSLKLIDCAGRTVTILNPDAETATIDTGSLSHNVYIVLCAMADSSHAAVKVTF